MENTFRWIILGLMVLAFIPSIYHRYRANQAGDKITFAAEERPLLYLRQAAALLLYGSLLVYLINPAWMAWASWPLPLWLRWTAVGVALVTIPFIYWLLNSLGRNITPTVTIRRDHQLVTDGPYRWIRHPLYSIAGLLVTAVSLIAANWLMLLGICLGLVALTRRTLQEEEMLLARFGDEYRRYMARTGRYFPRFF